VSNPVCRVLYNYNREGKIIEKTVCFGAQSNSVAYGYTPRGALASQKQGTILTEYRYDERNNLQQDKVQYSYDALGNVTNILRNDGRSVSLEWERGDSRETLNDFEKAVKLLGGTTKSVWDPKISTEGLVLKTNLGWIPFDSAKESTRYVIKRVTTHLDGAEMSRWESTEDSKQTGLNQGERFLVDLQGTVLGVVDSEGVLIESYQYDAWGKILSIQDGAGNPLQQTAVGNNALWHGMEYLWEAGLYNFYGSLYDPEAGCWMTQSPVRFFFQCKTREYIFCGNDPVNTVWRESPASRNQGGALYE
jgi:RHS repeat-associated protein